MQIDVKCSKYASRIEGASLRPVMVHEQVETPAFVYQEAAIRDALLAMHAVIGDSGCRLLYPLKPFSRANGLRFMRPYIDGFSVSSAFEAAFARTILGQRGTVHLTTPGMCPADLAGMAANCDFVAFNSLSQWDHFRDAFERHASCGLRLNPQLPVVLDDRYNPCRAHSKLGVPLDALTERMAHGDFSMQGLAGLHFHTNCDSGDFGVLADTIEHVEGKLEHVLDSVEWVNLGGGYLAEQAEHADRFRSAVGRLRKRFGVEMFIEPGASTVRAAGQFVTTVVDLFESEGVTVAVLDTTVNHLPEVFEYQIQPEVVGHQPEHPHAYLLAGSSCLAGDLFGTYRFDRRLEIGSRLILPNAGAYTLVKSHRFNGINLPTIYCVRENGDIQIEQRFTYEDYLNHNGVCDDASV
jgi:carboxynorspermidine decarboxylase